MNFHFFPSGYQIKRLLIVGLMRLLFIVLAFLVYDLILIKFPNDIHFNYEISMVLTLTICILIFLPMFERFLSFLKSHFLSEYLVEDSYSSRLAYKKFDINSLIQFVFPDMVKIAGADSGKLGILKENGSFDIYNFNRGRQKKIPTRGENTAMNQLMVYLLKHKNGVSISETYAHPNINSDFIALRADFIVPFLFREKIFGFLAISNIPDIDSAKQLSLLASQSALVIHNRNLSSQIVENIKYKQEEESAKRIQNLLQKGKIPKIENYTIDILSHDSFTLIEFYQISDEVWQFIILSSGGPERSAGLLHSHILGLLYARISKQKAHNFVEVKSIIEGAYEKANWKDKYGYLIGKIIKDNDIEILLKGNIFNIYSESEPSKQLTSVGWKNLISAYQLPFVIEVKGKKILRIGKES